MGAVHQALLRENEALRRKNEALLMLVAEAVGRINDEDFTARVIEELRGPEHAADYRARRGEWDGWQRREVRHAPKRRTRKVAT